MIDRDHELPVSKQCAALGISRGISRGSIYYAPGEVSASDRIYSFRYSTLYVAVFAFTGARPGGSGVRFLAGAIRDIRSGVLNRLLSMYRGLFP